MTGSGETLRIRSAGSSFRNGGSENSQTKKTSTVPFYDRLHSHVCNHPRCAANNPYYAQRVPTPSKRVLVAKSLQTPGSDTKSTISSRLRRVSTSSSSSDCLVKNKVVTERRTGPASKSTLSSRRSRIPIPSPTSDGSSEKKAAKERKTSRTRNGTPKKLSNPSEIMKGNGIDEMKKCISRVTDSACSEEQSSGCKQGESFTSDRPIFTETTHLDSCDTSTRKVSACAADEQKERFPVLEDLQKEHVNCESPTASVASNSMDFVVSKDISTVLEDGERARYHERSGNRDSLNSCNSSTSEGVSSALQVEPASSSSNISADERQYFMSSRALNPSTPTSSQYSCSSFTSMEQPTSVDENDDCYNIVSCSSVSDATDFSTPDVEREVSLVRSHDSARLSKFSEEAILKETISGARSPTQHSSSKESIEPLKVVKGSHIPWNDEAHVAESVSLKKGAMLNRKQAEDWMLDRAMKNLPVVEEGRVRVLVQAFENLVSLSEPQADCRDEDLEKHFGNANLPAVEC